MAFTPQDVHNPQIDCASCYVSDAADVLSDGTVAELNARCARLKQEVGVEFAIVVVDSIQDDDEVTFAETLFNQWGIGNKQNNSGLLLLYVTSIRAVRFQSGAGIEGLLPDAYLNRLLEEKVFPLMREDKPDEAFIMAVSDIEERLTSDEAREELFIRKIEARSYWAESILLYFILAFVALLVFAIWFYRITVYVVGNPHLDNSRKFVAFAPLRQLMLVFTFLFPLPLIFLFKRLSRFRKSIRYNAPVCGLCGLPMRVLSEQEEDAYLTENQQAEENLHSVDYDVWICPQCGAKKIFSYPDANNGRYKKCPNCGSHAYRFVRETIVTPPTPLTNGRGVKIYKCDVCKVEKRVEFVIPKTPIVVGGGSAHSGGFGGGGFGGGFTAGGGAGGRF